MISAGGVPVLVSGRKNAASAFSALDRVECERYPRIGDAQPLGARVITVGLALDKGLGLKLAKDLEVILTSVPAWRASRSLFGTTPWSFSHQAHDSRTNCTWVRPSGASAAATSRCQRSVACQSQKPGLSPGPRSRGPRGQARRFARAGHAAA